MVSQVKAEEDRDNVTEILQELQEVKNEATITKEERDSSRQRNEELEENLQLCQISISKLKEELQEVRKNVETTKEEVSSYRQRNEKLLDELAVRELSISNLKHQLQEVRTALAKAADSPPPSPAPSPAPSPHPSSSSSSSITQPKRKGGKQPASKGTSAKDKPSVSRKNSSSSHSSNKSHSLRTNGSTEHRHAPVTDSFTQTEARQMSELGPAGESATKEEVEEVIGEFQDKIVQMQELHAAEILDMEARHISESENLRRDTQAVEEECKALKTIIDKLRSNEVRPQQNMVCLYEWKTVLRLP